LLGLSSLAFGCGFATCLLPCCCCAAMLLLSASSQHVARVSGFVACWHAAAAAAAATATAATSATELLGMQFAIVALAQFKCSPIHCHRLMYTHNSVT